MKHIPKSVFKPRAFEYFRMVEERGEPLVITDRGRDALPCRKPPAGRETENPRRKHL